MVVNIKLSRQPGQPFGFRLVGGSDFEVPLTVSRVVDGSIAQAAGMQANDVVVRINDTDATQMTHEGAHEALVAAGNEFELGVTREGEADEAEQQEEIDKLIPDKVPTDEELAAIAAEEARIAKEAEEKAKAKAKKDAENTRWTTFLQKPNRPPLLPKNQQVVVSTYKPVIVRQPKPKCAPNYRSTPPPEPVKPKLPEKKEEEPAREQQTQEIVQVQEQISSTAETVSETTCVVTTTTTTTSTTSESLTLEELGTYGMGEGIKVEQKVTEEAEPEVSDEVASSTFADELANVQSQLMALHHLPKSIQSTLDEITKQLQSIIPTIKEKSKDEGKSADNQPDECVDSDDEDESVTGEETMKEVSQIEISSTVESTIETTVSTKTTVEVVKEEEHHPNIVDIEEYEEKERKYCELWEKKREKKEPADIKAELSAELKQKLSEDRTFKEKKARNFRGLQPRERPLILPGGRRWKNGKDAMNDEMIAEIISSQAELIMGTTLGVNFFKYQKPEKNLSFLQTSETYRTIHHMAHNENGIEKRPAMVACEDDILKCSSPSPLCQNSS